MRLETPSYEIRKIVRPTKLLIEAYKNVFNNSVWEEWVKCSSWCWFKTTFEKSPGSCPECNWSIEDFYSDEEVSWFIKDFTSKEYYEALEVFNKENKKVEWFTWWWWDYLWKINREKLELTKDEYKNLEDELDKIWIKPLEKQFYLSEIWVTLEWRWEWLWKRLFSSIQEEVQEKMDSVLRTSKNSPMYKMSKDLWYNEVFNYNDKDWRIIMASKNT